jgi:hypothetical protein
MGKYLHSYAKLRTLKVNTNMCTMDKLTKRWTFTSPKIDKPFGARFHFENFWEPMSIGVKVILLAGHDTMGLSTFHIEFGTLRGFMHMYMMVTCVPTKR